MQCKGFYDRYSEVTHCVEGTCLCSVDNAHVHASSAGMVQESAVEGTPDRFIAPEGECNIGNPSTDLAARAFLLDLCCCIDEVDCIIVVLSHAGAHCQDVWVKDDVLGVKTHILNQDLVGSCANAHFVCCSGSLQMHTFSGLGITLA